MVCCYSLILYKDFDYVSSGPLKDVVGYDGTKQLLFYQAENETNETFRLSFLFK